MEKGYGMYKLLKSRAKIVFLIMVVSVFSLFIPYSKAYAYEIPEYDTLLEDEIKEAVQIGDYKAGNVNFRLAVHKSFYSNLFMTAGFYEVNKHYYVEYDFTDFTEEYKYEKLMPVGTYQLAYVEFSDPVINMTYLCDPEEFTVTEDGYPDNIWINVDYTQTETVNIQNEVTVNDGKGFSGFLNMTYYNKTDTEFTQQEKDDMDQDTDYVQRIQIFHVSQNNPSKFENVLTAGDVCISNINVYDEEKNPLNVYYDPNYFTLDRSMSYDGKINKQFIYVFKDSSELTDEQLSTIKADGYVLKEASKMDTYFDMPNEQFNVYKGEFPLFTVYDGDIPAGEPGNKIVAPVEVQEEESSVAAPEVTPQKTVAAKKSISIPNIVLVIIIVIAVISVSILVKRKRK